MDETADSAILNAVRDVFSLTPSSLAQETSIRVLNDLKSLDANAAEALIWVDFDDDLQFIEGGVSDVFTRLTEFVDTPQRNDRIMQIFDLVTQNGAQPGSVYLNEDQDVIYWLAPLSMPQRNAGRRLSVRCLAVHQRLFAEVVRRFNEGVSFTNAEIRVLFQLIGGASMRSASARDGVSFETKRAQFKSASSKLQVTGQVEATRLLVGQMVALAMSCVSATRPAAQSAEFSTEFFQGVADLSVRRLKNDRPVRFWEMGPEGGQPLLAVHGYLFPFLMLNAPRHLEHHDIRLIIPIRPGYLDGAEHAETSQLGELPTYTVETLVDFVAESFDQPISVLGHATGAIYAAQMLGRAQDQFRQLIVSSINLPDAGAQSTTFSGRFFGGVMRLAGRQRALDMLTKQYQRAVFSSEAMTKMALKRLFKDNSSDLRLLTGDIGHGASFEWYRKLHASSMIGIPADFGVATRPHPLDLADIDLPVTFLHGDQDPSTPIERLGVFTSKPNVEVWPLKGGGQMAYGSHAEDFWREVRRLMSAQLH